MREPFQILWYGETRLVMEELQPTTFVILHMLNNCCRSNWLQSVQCRIRSDRVNEFILEREGFVKKDIRYDEEMPTVPSVPKPSSTSRSLLWRKDGQLRKTTLR